MTLRTEVEAIMGERMSDAKAAALDAIVTDFPEYLATIDKPTNGEVKLAKLADKMLDLLRADPKLMAKVTDPFDFTCELVGLQPRAPRDVAPRSLLAFRTQVICAVAAWWSPRKVPLYYAELSLAAGQFYDVMAVALKAAGCPAAEPQTVYGVLGPPGVKKVCEWVYARTQDLYDRLPPGTANGFKILYGPPQVGAPFLFIGPQPVGPADDAGEHATWPECFALHNAERIWDSETLTKCFGLRAVFFRPPDAETWNRSPYAWGLVQECTRMVDTLVQVLRPQRIVVIGGSTFKLLSNRATTPALKSAQGRVLVSKAEEWRGREVYVIERVNAQLSSDDYAAMSHYFRENIEQ